MLSHPSFDPIALDVYDVYIVNDHGVELKAKAPPLISNAMFGFKLSPMAYRGMQYIYYVGHHVDMHL